MPMRDTRLLVIALAFMSFPLTVPAEDIPALPKLNLANFLPAIRGQVQDADATARAHPRSADASGKLGMVLDAYLQYESAAVCYERACQLDSHSFAWAYYLGSLQFHQGKYNQASETLREAFVLGLRQREQK